MPEAAGDQRGQLEQAISALEAQRAILGDAVVDTAVAPPASATTICSSPGRRKSKRGRKQELHGER
jgi:hypothetical protein